MKKSAKVILFDIDYTLFDSDLYRDKFFPMLASELGINNKNDFLLLKKTVDEKTRLIAGFFHPMIFLKELLKHSKRPTNLKRLTDIFFKNDLYKTSLYKDVVTVLDNFVDEDKYIVGILSTGHKMHQGKKIEQLKKYFQKKHIHIFPNKITMLNEVLDKYKDYSKIYLIDDLQEVLKAAKDINKNIKTIWLKKTKKYDTTPALELFKPDYTFTNLSDVLTILKQ